MEMAGGLYTDIYLQDQGQRDTILASVWLRDPYEDV